MPFFCAQVCDEWPGVEISDPFEHINQAQAEAEIWREAGSVEVVIVFGQWPGNAIAEAARILETRRRKEAHEDLQPSLFA